MVTPTSTPLQPAIEAYRRGDLPRALALAGEQVALAPAGDYSAHAVLCEVLHRAGRIDELADFLDRAPDFQQDPRGRLMRAKAARRQGDHATAEALLRPLLLQDDMPSAPLRRIAAFELVATLAAQGRHAESWDAAAQAHRQAARPFAVDGLVAALRATARASAAELSKLPRASRPAPHTACVLGLPRSGTTLLEQMLDRHSRIQGVGELPLPGQMADAMARHGGWPAGAMRVPRPMLDEMQRQYLQETRGRRQLPAEVWTLDKTVFPMLQPLFVAAVLPGAKLLRILRDPRDNATSLFLNNMHPSWGWTASVEAIRQLIAAEREFMPVILDKLGLDVLTLQFEALVDEPEAQLRRVLGHLGLGWEDACLRPHENDRLVFTASHEQVRRPLNREGIGRWMQHREVFGPEWDALI